MGHSKQPDEETPGRDLAAKVMEKAGYTAEELGQEIEKKKAEYEMLTDEGALTLIASEIGVVPGKDGEPPTMRIEDLRPGMQDLDIVGRIVTIQTPREFTRRDGSPGYVCSLLLADRTSSVRLTLWDEECRLLEDVQEQDIIKVLGGICRSGMRGVEIHTARRARIVLNPKVSEDPRVADLDTVVEAVQPQATRKRISQLAEGDTNIEIRATVVRFYRVWVYDACPNCGRKVTDGRCQTCGDVSPEPRAILDIGVDDSSGFLRAKFFGEAAQEFLGASASTIQSGLEALVGKGMDRRRASEELLNREYQDILGKEILLRGRVSIDEFRGLVISVEDMANPDPVQEACTVLQEVGV